MNLDGNRFYLQALGVTGLFIGLLLVLWIASGGPATEAEVRNANGTKTAIALTEGALLGPFITSTAVTACMRKFLTILNAMLRDRQPFRCVASA